MKGILLTSHGPMAQGILETSKLFFGEQEQIKACCLDANDNPDDFIEVLKSAIDEIDTGDGVIVFCDMLFGSPCNCMARIIAEDMEGDALATLEYTFAAIKSYENGGIMVTPDPLPTIKVDPSAGGI